MDIVVLGAGVVGLCAAHALASEGHRVTVVERLRGVALDASHANGGQLSYSYVAPLAGPGVIPNLPKWLLRRDSPVRFRPRADPGQWSWSLRFLLACRRGRSERSTRQLLALAALSREAMHQLAAQGLAFDFAPSGKLVVYSTEAELRAGQRQMALQARFGCDQRLLDADACLALEPALRHLRPRLLGGIHTPSEDSGDCRLFCEALQALLSRPGTMPDGSGRHPVRFLLGVSARQIVVAGRRFRALATDAGTIEADAMVLAGGAGSRALARAAGFALPIYPLKGYSLSLPIADPAAAPRMSVTDFSRKTVYARLGERLRVAGMADIEGRAPDFAGDRLTLLIAQAREAFPDAASFRRVDPWCGMRPATPTGLPIVCAAPVADNLFLDTGHGALGFTLAMGSARLVADLVAGRRPSVELDR